MLTADDQGFVSIWDAMRGTLVTRIAAQKGKGRLSPSGQQLATIGSDGGVNVWRLPSGGPLTDPELSTMAALSVDRDRVATVTTKTEIAMTFAVGQRIQIGNRRQDGSLPSWMPTGLECPLCGGVRRAIACSSLRANISASGTHAPVIWRLRLNRSMTS